MTRTEFIIKAIARIGSQYRSAESWSGLIEDAVRYPGYVEALAAIDALPKGIYTIEKIFVRL